MALLPGLINDKWGGAITMVGAGFFIFVGLFGFWATLTNNLTIWRFGAVWQLSLFEAIRSFGMSCSCKCSSSSCAFSSLLL